MIFIYRLIYLTSAMYIKSFMIYDDELFFTQILIVVTYFLAYLNKTTLFKNLAQDIIFKI